MASIDAESCVIVRDLRNPDDAISHFRVPNDNFEPLETASIIFNANSNETLFIAINN